MTMTKLSSIHNIDLLWLIKRDLQRQILLRLQHLQMHDWQFCCWLLLNACKGKYGYYLSIVHVARLSLRKDALAQHFMCIRCVSSSRKKGRISSLLFLKVTSGDFAFRNLVGAHPVRTWKYVTNHKYCRAKHFTTDSRDQIGGSFWNRCVFSTRVKGDNRLPSGSPTSESPTWWAFLRWDFLSPSVIRKSRLKYYFLFELL